MNNGDTDPDLPIPPEAAALIAKQRQLVIDADRMSKMPGGHLRSMELFEDARQIGGRICRALNEHHVMKIRTKWGVSTRCQRCGRRIDPDGRALP